MSYFAKIKVSKVVETETKKGNSYNNIPAEFREDTVILGEFEITAPTLEKLQEKVDAHTKLVEE